MLVGQTVYAIAVADLNNDGKPDLVARSPMRPPRKNDLYVFLNTGSSSQALHELTGAPADNDLGGGLPRCQRGDVNADGLPDLLFPAWRAGGERSPRP